MNAPKHAGPGGGRADPRDRPAGPPPAVPAGLPSAKIHRLHRQRLAIVSVRQSSPQQVLEHRESTARPYALVDRAIALGWSPERVLVIDDDQGRSGPTAADRPGVQRLLLEVNLDRKSTRLNS